LTAPPAVRQPEPGSSCRIEHCALWPQAALPFCHSHAATWRANGRPDIDQFVRRFTESSPTVDETIHLGLLGGQLRLEMRYVLQARHDERRGKVTPGVVMRVVRLLAGMPVTSMTDYDEHTWHQHGRSAVRDSRTRGFLSYAYRAVADLVEAGGGEAEYAREAWQMRRLGFEGGRSLRFDVIPQPWLREPAKRWTRWRLASGLGLEAASRPIRVITCFARFLDQAGIDAITEIDRQVLERYLADLHAEMAGSQRQGCRIGLLGGFFTAIRQHRWDTGLPASAMFFTEDYPKRAERFPRALAEHVMAQMESTDNLNRWDSPAYRLVTVILMRCGLRVSDALRLPSDCVVTDADAAPYLRYFNHKMKHDALVPIDEELRDLLDQQRQRNADRWPEGTPGLFPRPTKNLDGTAPIASSTYRLALYRWLDRCDIHDEHGHPVTLTPHQWRHTLGQCH
jgi:integrase